MFSFASVFVFKLPSISDIRRAILKEYKRSRVAVLEISRPLEYEFTDRGTSFSISIYSEAAAGA